MDIISAYREVGTYRGAAEVTGTTHKTVKRVIARHEAGGAAPERANRGHNYDGVAELVAERVGKTSGCSHEHSAWPGTVSISATTLLSVVTDVADSVHRSGTTALVLVNGHGGNYALSNLVQEANAHGNRMALFPTGQDWKDARSAAHLETTMHEDMHSGEIETSILLYAHPELVRDGYETADWIADDRRHLLIKGMSAYTTSGVIGRPSLGSADKGKTLLTSLVHSFADVLRVLDI